MTWQLVALFGITASAAVAVYGLRLWSQRDVVKGALGELQERVQGVEAAVQRSAVAQGPRPVDSRFGFMGGKAVKQP